jgi:hypothetical protein
MRPASKAVFSTLELTLDLEILFQHLQQLAGLLYVLLS